MDGASICIAKEVDNIARVDCVVYGRLQRAAGHRDVRTCNVHDRSTWDCARGHTRTTVVITGHKARLCIHSIHSLRGARSPAAGGAGRPTLRAVEVSSARTDLGMFVTDVPGSLGRLRDGFEWVILGLGVVEGHTRVGRRTGYAPWGLLWSPKRANRV